MRNKLTSAESNLISLKADSVFEITSYNILWKNFFWKIQDKFFIVFTILKFAKTFFTSKGKKLK